MTEAGQAEILRRALRSGSLASVFSAAALGLCGEWEDGHPAAPTNATSQWLWGRREALRSDRPDLRHTAVGYTIHHLASLFWAALYERWLEQDRATAPGARFVRAGALSALACFVDLKLTPPRLRPGFERRLSAGSLAIVYGAFALGLAAMPRERYSQPDFRKRR